MLKISSTHAVSVPINLSTKLGFVSVNGPRETYYVAALRTRMYRVIYILGAATDGCRSRPCIACPPLHGASNCRCSQTLALFLAQFPSNCHAHRRTFAKRRR